MDYKITHDKKNHKFTTTIDGSECYLSYSYEEDDVLDFYFTFVPGELRGKGVAAELVEAGLKYAIENNLRIIPRCSYVNLYVQRHGEYKKIIESD